MPITKQLLKIEKKITD